MEILPRHRALCARAARGPRRSGHARAQPTLARRVLALGTRHAWFCRLPFLSPRFPDGLMATAAPAGYSGKQLWQKLGLKEGQRLFVADAPPALPQLLAGAPKGIVRLARLAEFDIAILFVKSRSALAAALARTLPRLADGGMIWVAWP